MNYTKPILTSLDVQQITACKGNTCNGKNSSDAGSDWAMELKPVQEAA